jgi:hypothetical protein
MVAARANDEVIGGTALESALSDMAHDEEWIVADELEIDHSYQRPRVRTEWVKQIAEAFDPELFKPLLVNRRRWDNNRLFVMDGQHRLLAVRRMGWGSQRVPCLVYDNLPYDTEAKQFDTQGYNKPLTPQERFRSALARNEPDEALINGAVRRAGYQLNLDHSDMAEGRIPAVQTLKSILRQHRSRLLIDVLEVCRDAFGTDHGPRAGVLAGMAKFLARYQNHERFDRRRLVAALRTTSAERLSVDGSTIKRTMGVPLGDAVAFKIHQAYNYRLRDERELPEWTFGRAKTA